MHFLTQGDQYLVVGVGFLGQRMVNRLLERGESKIRCFDIVPNNPFEGNKNVEYVVGNVLDKDDLKNAMKNVDTVYSTFALVVLPCAFKNASPFFCPLLTNCVIPWSLRFDFTNDSTTRLIFRTTST
jgi:hypothetical protein